MSSADLWSFEEGSGVAALDVVGTNRGTLMNGTLRIADGRMGRALRFDGVDDYVSVGDSPSLESKAFSVSLWVRRDGAQPSSARILSKGDTRSAPWGSYKFEFAGASDEFINWHVGFRGGASATVSNVTPLPSGQWMQLLGVFDGQRLSLFVNGRLESTRLASGKALRFDGVPLTIGGSAATGNFNGDVDEVRYFSRALSTGDAQWLFAQDSTTTPTGGTLTLASPNENVDWLVGTPQTISWSQTLPAGTPVQLDISRDGGTTWALLAGPLTTSTTAGTYVWSVDGPVSLRTRIRVTGGGLSDVSDADFRVSAPAIVVGAPSTTADAWQAGGTAAISWTSNLPLAESVRIELSRDGGTTFAIVLAASTPADGNESIAVRPEWVASDAKVRISWSRDPQTSSVSAVSFPIEAAPRAVRFLPTTAEFPNPERGFFSWTELAYTDFSFVRAKGNTLTRPYFRLDAYRDTALPASYLGQLTDAFSKARKAGIKVIPRFAYNWGPYPRSEPDATRARIEQHLQQLAPVLAANEDVISSVEAGFVGAWGEWHTSTNGLDTDPAAKAAVLAALLKAVPSSRMVALRYPSDMETLNGPPIVSTEAFSGSNHARVGSHQDCFLASEDDWGTWGRSGNPYSYDKAYIAANGQFAVVGGETCNPNPPRSSCPTALYEMEYMHWSYLNLDYEPAVIQGFRDGGCFDEIRRRLGYRFELASASYSPIVQRGSTLQLDLQLTNLGFAAMFNERPVFALMTSGSTQYAVKLNTDPRQWAPGTSTTISQAIPIPSTLPAGTYTLALWLPDKAPSIADNPSFAVRFANEGVWDEVRGQNILASDLMITP